MKLSKVQGALGRFMPKGRFLKGAFTLSFGTIVGQSLVILSSPLLTRLYTPDDFGSLGVLLSISAFFVLISALRYELAILLPANGILSYALIKLSLFLVFIVSVTVLGLIFFFADTFGELTKVPALFEYVWLIPTIIFIAGLIKVLMYWLLREEKAGIIAKARIYQDGVMVAFQLGLGYTAVGMFGLVFGYAIGILAGLSKMGKSFLKRGLKVFQKVKSKHVKYVLIRYKKFPIFTIWGDMANVVAKQLPMLLFAGLFGPAIAGFYLLANRVANAPVALISEGTGKAFMAAAASSLKENSLDKLSEKVFNLLIRSSLAPFVIAGIIAPELFSLIFGSEWAEGGDYLQLLLIQALAVFVFVPILTLFSVLEKQKLGLVFQIIMLLLSLAALYVGSYYESAKLAVALFSLGTGINYVFFGLMMLKIAGVNAISVSKYLSVEVIIAALIGSIFFLAKNYIKTNGLQLLDWILWLFLVACCIAAYFLIKRIKKSALELIEIDAQVNKTL